MKTRSIVTRLLSLVLSLLMVLTMAVSSDTYLTFTNEELLDALEIDYALSLKPILRTFHVWTLNGTPVDDPMNHPFDESCGKQSASNRKVLTKKEKNELQVLMSSKFAKSFQELLFDYIDEKGLKDVEVYKKARVSKQVFSNIRKSVYYIPKKETVIALCLALNLTLSKTTKLLSCCGYSLSNCITFDRIIQFCIENSFYDIFEINELLLEYHQDIIG